MENNNQVYAFEIDGNGHIIESHFINLKTNKNVRMITAEIPRGIFKPKWNGSEWIEGATQEEIAELTKVEPSPPTQTEILEQRLADLELMLAEILFN